MNITEFLPLTKDCCVLEDTRIDLWQFSLNQQPTNAHQLLNREELARAERFYFAKHKRRFITARVTLRTVLARYLNTPPEQLQFLFNKQGKPYIADADNIEFNMSHSGELGIIAIGKGKPLGVDIECYSARPYDGIAKTLFSATELEQFLKLPARIKPALFFHVWSQKEAFIKATGLGLSYPTKEFSVPVTIPTRHRVADALHNTTWQLHSFMPQVACSGALCYHPQVNEIRHGHITLTETI